MNIFGREKDLCEGLDESEISKASCDTLIFDTVYKRDHLWAVSLVSSELQSLLTTRRSSRESYRDFEALFGAQIEKFNSLCATIALSQSMAAIFMLEKCWRITALFYSSSGSSVKGWNFQLIQSRLLFEICRIWCHRNSRTPMRQTYGIVTASIRRSSQLLYKIVAEFQ